MFIRLFAVLTLAISPAVNGQCMYRLLWFFVTKSFRWWHSNMFFSFLFSTFRSLTLAQCYTPEGITGQCISVYSCPNVLAQFQGTLTPATTYYLRSLQCGSGDGQYPHVCCIIVQNRQQIQQRSRSESTRLTQFNRRNSGTGNILPAYGMCGLISLSQRIIGGDDTQLDDYPWMAILEYRKSFTYLFSYLCSHNGVHAHIIPDKFGFFFIVKLCKVRGGRSAAANAICDRRA